MKQKCEHVFRIKVELFLDIPLSMEHRLSKKNIASKEVKVDGANWPKQMIYCEKCGCRFNCV